MIGSHAKRADLRNFFDVFSSSFSQSPHIDVDNANTMSTPSVSIAAKKLSILLQQNGNMAHQPDSFTAQILNTWLETHLPVSCCLLVGCGGFFSLVIIVWVDLVVDGTYKKLCNLARHIF